jgi:hypothetical protein
MEDSIKEIFERQRNLRKEQESSPKLKKLKAMMAAWRESWLYLYEGGHYGKELAERKQVSKGEKAKEDLNLREIKRMNSLKINDG